MLIRSFFLISYVVFSSWLCHGQEEYNYVGALNLQDTVLISYQIKFTENKGLLKGYSITDIGGDHETRSSIEGFYDNNNKQISFKETDIVYTKSPVSQKDFCFVNILGDKFTLGKTKNFKSKFVGLFSDGTECINGEIILNSYVKVQERIEKVSKKLKRSKLVSDSIKQKIDLRKMLDSLGMNVLRHNEILSLFSKSKSIQMIIYDAGKEDGDQISIEINGKPMLSKYEASKRKKIIDINLASDVTSINFIALNEGKITPNTVVVEIWDGSNSIRALSNLKKGESTQIDILKK